MLVELTERLDDPTVAEILSDCLFQPAAPERIAAALDRYRSGGSSCLFGWECDGALAAVAGIKQAADGSAELMHIAVAPEFRGFGIGKRMIHELMARRGICRLEAETDDDAVGFYRRCGFAVESLGEKYPGCVRYRCILFG